MTQLMRHASDGAILYLRKDLLHVVLGLKVSTRAQNGGTAAAGVTFFLRGLRH